MVELMEAEVLEDVEAKEEDAVAVEVNEGWSRKLGLERFELRFSRSRDATWSMLGRTGRKGENRIGYND